MGLFGLFIDPLYLAVMIPGMLLAGWASLKVKRAFARYSRMRIASGMTGAEMARQMLRRSGIHNVTVEQSRGMLSDHYDPATRTVRLSPQVYSHPSVAAIAVAAHEVGHAIQHARGYAPLALRSASVPAAQVGSWAPWIILVGGFMIGILELVYLGIALFSVVVFFQIITLPVEFNASSRARRYLVEFGLISPREQAGVAAVLNAAAMTYVAAAVTAVMTLLYYLFRAGLLGGGADD